MGRGPAGAHTKRQGCKMTCHDSSTHLTQGIVTCDMARSKQTHTQTRIKCKHAPAACPAGCAAQRRWCHRSQHVHHHSWKEQKWMEQLVHHLMRCWVHHWMRKQVLWARSSLRWSRQWRRARIMRACECKPTHVYSLCMQTHSSCLSLAPVMSFAHRLHTVLNTTHAPSMRSTPLHKCR